METVTDYDTDGLGGEESLRIPLGRENRVKGKTGEWRGLLGISDVRKSCFPSLSLRMPQTPKHQQLHADMGLFADWWELGRGISAGISIATSLGYQPHILP